MGALLPDYKRVEGQYNLQGYLYKTEKLLSICPHCNTDLSEIALNRFYCIGCGTEIDREGKFRKMEIEFFELNGDWLTHKIKTE